jgi:RNA polymerase sigma-70 factor (ECF subfamily)
MGKILKRKLLDILDAQMSEKRRLNQLSDPLETPSDDESSEQEPMPIFQSPDTEKSRIFLRLAVEKVLAELHPDQVKLCNLAMEGLNVTEISRETNKPRSTIYDELKRIKEIFNKEDLQNFF